jgi:hypothetical protein
MFYVSVRRRPAWILKVDLGKGPFIWGTVVSATLRYMQLCICRTGLLQLVWAFSELWDAMIWLMTLLLLAGNSGWRVLIRISTIVVYTGLSITLEILYFYCLNLVVITRSWLGLWERRWHLYYEGKMWVS